ncbi:MAG: hypothetical protein P1V35_10060 [Planctomycetota bacterium]|nr:hypothetical protein [Planctomycetota bacterium]
MTFALPAAVQLVFASLTRLAPVLAGAFFIAPSAAQEILIDRWSDSDYRLSCDRPADTILIPAAQAEIEGRADLVTLSSGNYSGTVRGVDATKGSQNILTEFLGQALQDANGGEGFEFRSLPLGGDRPEDGFGEWITYLGERALCVRLLDERPESQLVFELRIVQRGSTALRFLVSGPLAHAGEDGRGFDAFFDSFQLTEGEFQHRAYPPTALDFDGPGYQVRGNTLQSGELGLRMTAPQGWRIESRPLAMDWSFASHALFVSPQTKGRLTLGANVAPNRALSQPSSDPDLASPFEVAGQSFLAEEIFPTGAPGVLRVQQGVLRAPDDLDGVVDAQMQLVLDRKHLGKLEPQVREALASATRLSAAECAKIISQTTGSNDPQVGFGKQAWLRHGTYFNRAHGLRWSPPNGVWIHLVEPAKQYAMDRETLLMSYNHGNNIICELRAKSTRSSDLDRAHRRGLQRTFDVSRTKVKDVPVEEGQFLGHKALRTTGRNLLGTGVLDFTTVLMDGHAIHISVSCTVECTDEKAAELQQQLLMIRDELRLDPGLNATESSDDRHVDPQFGFSVDLAGQTWTAQPQEPRPGQGLDQVQVQFVRRDGLTMTVSARWVDPIGYLDDPHFARHRGFYEAARGMVFQGGTIRKGTPIAHQGKTVHVVRSKDQGIEWETAILQRGPFVYLVNAWNTEDPNAELLSEVMGRIAFDQ